MDKIVTHTIKGLLKHTWLPFFSRYGRLTEIQRLAIPTILDASNVIISSPTASGKTETVVAPAAELLCPIDRDGLLVLYIVPTRALANDTLARISEPLAYLDIRTELKHGDKPLLPKKIPHFLITTPESLDSLICRRPEIFTQLQTVILDEIHLLDNTYRGDQLRILMNRVRHLTSRKMITTHILSATLGKPKEVAERYGSDFHVISVPGQREIQNIFLSSCEELKDWVRKHKIKKILCFANSRSRVESMSQEMADLWKPYPVVAHHGSLSRDKREEAEDVMKDADAAVCVSTSTLEIGIDIGDIDLIVLADPPQSMASLHQRLGRGNRRKQIIQSACIVKTDEEEKTLSVMFQIAGSGLIIDEPYAPDLSVVVQQIISCLFATPVGIVEDELIEILISLGSLDQIKDILSHLEKRGLIEIKDDRWYASTTVMDMGEKGILHSNIPDHQERMVVDINTSKNIGKIYGNPDSVFLLSGRAWQVVSFNRSQIVARHHKGEAISASFSPRCGHGAFNEYLPSKYQKA